MEPHVQLQQVCHWMSCDTHVIVMFYHSINGIPACANNELLTTILRNEWNFPGTCNQWGGLCVFNLNYNNIIYNASLVCEGAIDDYLCMGPALPPPPPPPPPGLKLAYVYWDSHVTIFITLAGYVVSDQGAIGESTPFPTLLFGFHHVCTVLYTPARLNLP